MRYLPLLLALVLPLASAAPRDVKTQAVYDYLLNIWGKQTIAGQADLTWHDATDMAQRVHDDTGKYPALMGFDFMNTWSTGDGAHQVDEAIAWARRGGLVTFCWHWRDPSAPAGTQGNFYAREPDARKNTAFTIPVRAGRLDTESAAGRALDADIDRLAVQLATLQAAGVTVLWRPLHEASGDHGNGWFWWGRKRTDGVPNAQAYVLLYRHLFDRLVNDHGLHNLIWVWNGQDAAWYPGDDVVDIVGVDAYDQGVSGRRHRWREIYGRPLGIHEVARFAARRHKPLSIPEWGLMPRGRRWLGGGDDPAYVAGIDRVLRTRRVAYQAYFYAHDTAAQLRRSPRSRRRR